MPLPIPAPISTIYRAQVVIKNRGEETVFVEAVSYFDAAKIIRQAIPLLAQVDPLRVDFYNMETEQELCARGHEMTDYVFIATDNLGIPKGHVQDASGHERDIGELVVEWMRQGYQIQRMTKTAAHAFLRDVD